MIELDDRGGTAKTGDGSPGRFSLISIATLAASIAALVGVGALFWLYARDAHVLQTEVAALRTQVAAIQAANESVARGMGLQQPPAQVSDNAAQITDLANRLAILEQNWRSPQGLPAIEPPASLSSVDGGVTAAASGGANDCIPVGTRFLATPGEAFPICGEDVSVELAAIGVTDVVLSTGKTAPVGVATVLGDGKCMVTVMSADGVSGFAELRIGCT